MKRDDIGNRCGEQVWANAWAIAFDRARQSWPGKEDLQRCTELANTQADIARECWARWDRTLETKR